MKPLSDNDIHALASYFFLHYSANVITKPMPRPGSAERAAMALFGLVEKKGAFRLTARGRRAMRLAKS